MRRPARSGRAGASCRPVQVPLGAARRPPAGGGPYPHDAPRGADHAPCAGSPHQQPPTRGRLPGAALRQQLLLPVQPGRRGLVQRISFQRHVGGDVPDARCRAGGDAGAHRRGDAARIRGRGRVARGDAAHAAQALHHPLYAHRPGDVPGRRPARAALRHRAALLHARGPALPHAQARAGVRRDAAPLAQDPCEPLCRLRPPLAAGDHPRPHQCRGAAVAALYVETRQGDRLSAGL